MQYNSNIILSVANGGLNPSGYYSSPFPLPSSIHPSFLYFSLLFFSFLFSYLTYSNSITDASLRQHQSCSARFPVEEVNSYLLYYSLSLLICIIIRLDLNDKSSYTCWSRRAVGCSKKYPHLMKQLQIYFDTIFREANCIIIEGVYVMFAKVCL